MDRLRALVADDYEDIRRGLRSQLEDAGFEVSEAADGREAVEMYGCSLAEGRPYDLAVLDHLMPHTKGDVAAVKIKERAAASGVEPPKMFMLTGSNDSALMSRARAAGFGAVFIKPDFEELIARIVGRPAVTAARAR